MATSNHEYTHQHTVPIAYLANFGIDGNKGRESTLFFCNIIDRRFGKTGVEAFPVEKLFYDIDELGEHKKILEKLFCNVEGALSSLLDDLFSLICADPEMRESNTIPLSATQKDAMAAQIAMLTTRTRAFRNRYKSIYQQIKEGLPFARISEYGKSDFKRLHNTELLSMQTSEFYADMFNDRNWLFIINHSNIPFITSDNPVVMIDHRIDKRNPVSAVSDEVTYFVPISPLVAIEIYDKKVLKIDMLCLDVSLDSIIQGYNGQIYRNCTRFLFSNKSFQTDRAR